MKVSDDVRATHGPDGAILLNIRHGQMFRLNLVGSRILELLKIGLSEPEIAATIATAFSLDRSLVERDLEEFLAHLRAHHLIEVRETEPRVAS